MEVRPTKQQQDEIVIDFFDEQIAKGLKRRQAINATCKKFNILHPQTLYNTEARVRKREWEARHGKREA